MSNTMNYNCPCCGGPLSFSGASGKLECAACGNSYEMDDLEAMELKQEGEQVAFAVEAEAYGADDAMSAYTCKSCGAELVCDGTTTAMECPYCGSPTILPERIQGGVKPEKVVPFVISKEQATGMFNDYFKGKKLLPNVFLESKNRISEVRKLFVPYWLFDCDAYADIVYDAEKRHTTREGEWEVTRTEHFVARRCGTIGFDSIPVDGSEKMDDRITESLEPYDLKKAVPFQSAVLSGAMADRADVAAEACQGRAVERVKTSTESAMTDTVNGYSSVSVRKKYIESQNGKATPVLMPVWLITTDKQENGAKKTYTFAINGQTGKLTCDVPYAKGKAWSWFLGLFAGITAIACALLAVLDSLESGPIAVGVIAALIIALIVVSVFKGQLKTAHSVSDAANYVRPGSLNLSVKRDRYLYTTTQRRKIETNKEQK